MTGRVSLPQSLYSSDEKKSAFYAAALDQLRNIPGVTDAAWSDALPFTGQGGESSFEIKGRKTAPGDPGPHANIRVVSAGYFRALRIPILRGREFAPADRAATQKVAIVDEALAKQYFPHQDPLGKEIGFDEKNYYTIVGLVRHARVSSLDSDSSRERIILMMRSFPIREHRLWSGRTFLIPNSFSHRLKAPFTPLIPASRSTIFTRWMSGLTSRS